MDAVPLDFCQRVAETWKCCDGAVDPLHPHVYLAAQCNCVLPAFSDHKWTFSEAKNVALCVAFIGTEWRYCFGSVSGNELTLSDLLSDPDFKKLRISVIRVFSTDKDTADRMNLKPSDDVGMEKLLKIVSFLTNEPKVSIENVEFNSPERALLLKWLEDRWFSHISFFPYQPIFERVLRKQLSRRIPTAVTIEGFTEGSDFVAKQLATGRATCLETLPAVFSPEVYPATGALFAAEVMKGIIQSFLESSSEKTINISAFFEESIADRLKKMESDGWCMRVDGKFVFENPFQRLEVSVILPVPGRLSRYSIVSCSNENDLSDSA